MYGLFDAFARNANRLRVINARHEQTTAYMALGYAQSTGKPSAFTVVPGPGVLNTMGALTTAWGVNAPVHVPHRPGAEHDDRPRPRPAARDARPARHAEDSLLKWAERIEHPTEAPQVMARAFQEMLSGRPGPVALEMPWDMFGARRRHADGSAAASAPNPCPIPSKIAALAKLVERRQGADDLGRRRRGACRRPRSWRWPRRSARRSCRSAAASGIVDVRHPLSLTIARRLQAVGHRPTC